MSAPEFSLNSRSELLERLSETTFDLAIVGGGINGAGIARDAAMRGLSVALLEKDDFASGTSSRSSKLVHGGVRYLEHFHFGLVHEASLERATLLRIAPHLVRPLPFLMPVFRGNRYGPFLINMGLWLYDGLSFFRNVQNHQNLGVADFERMAPGLRAGDLRGGCLFYDARTDDARLTLETARAAHARGAVALTRACVMGFLEHRGSVCGVRIRDGLDGSELEVKARVVVNASGPWSDHVRRLQDKKAQPHLRITKGVHIILPPECQHLDHAVVLISPIDGRVLFAIPWEGMLLVGTTDTDFDGDLDELAATPEEVDYLLETLTSYFPSLRLGRSDVLGTYAGVRPLMGGPDGGSESSASREHKIIEESSGLLSLVGGKLTTYRKMASQVVDLAVARLRSVHGLRAAEPCRTAVVPLRAFTAEGPRGRPKPSRKEVPPEAVSWVGERYPGEEDRLFDLIRSDASLARPLAPHSPHLGADVVFACRYEMALDLSDLMIRRLSLYYREPNQGLAAAPRVAALASTCLGWTEAEQKRQVDRYASLVASARSFRAS